MNDLIEKGDPRVADLFRRLENAGKLLGKLDIPVRKSFHNQRFITDKELSGKLKISRRTLQQYRSSGLIPYYLICGKVIYMESEIQRLLEKARQKTIGEHTLV